MVNLRPFLASLAARATRWAYAPYPPIDVDGDPYRFCIYCGCDCYEDSPDHLPGCATVTGLRPVRPSDLDMRGPHDPYAYGMLCMDCLTPFKVGDVYAVRGGGDIGEIVCVGCRVLNPNIEEAR